MSSNQFQGLPRELLGNHLATGWQGEAGRAILLPHYRTHQGTQRAHLLAHGHSREGDLLLPGETPFRGSLEKKIP